MTNDDGNSDSLRKRNLYRLPWSLNDNPIGWVEITDLCNISCRGCYRTALAGHKSVEDIRTEILFLQEWRNITNVHLAGGEPLIHPDIVEIVQFIHDRGLNPVIITNGHRLTRELLIRLRDAGLGEMSFHIDSGQIRPEWTGRNEIELNALRQNYVDLLCEVGDVTCNFNMTINPCTIASVPEVIRWVLSTHGKVNGMTLITLRGFPRQGIEFVEGDKKIDLNAPSIGMVNDVDDELSTLRSNDLYQMISSAFPGYEAASYLGGTKTMSSFKWLIANAICCNDDIVGSVSPKTVEIAQAVHHLRYGRYYAGGRGRVGKMILLMAAVDRRIRRVLLGLLRRPGRLFGKIYTLTVSVIEPNTLSPDGEFEMCDSCPDMTYHEGRLVHSCRLDEYRMYGTLVKPVITAD